MKYIEVILFAIFIEKIKGGLADSKLVELEEVKK